MIEIKLHPGQFEEITKKGYNLDIIFLLKMVEGEYDFISTNPKILQLITTMERKGLVSNGKLTLDGQDLLAYLCSSETTKLTKKKKVDEPFERWWKTFPGTDTFEYKGKKFKGTRALKVKKDDCKTKINKILNEGEYTIDDLIGALKLEVEQKKEDSYKTGQNKIKYMHNSLTYLIQMDYEPFIDLLKSGYKIEETKITPTAGVEI